MPRRKQDCPKRMKWEAEGSPSGLGEEGSPSEEIESAGSAANGGDCGSGPETAAASPVDGEVTEAEGSVQELHTSVGQPSPVPSPFKNTHTPIPRDSAGSPRCPSRDSHSRESVGQRCPSRESLNSLPEVATRSARPQASPVTHASPMILTPTPPLASPIGSTPPSIVAASVGALTPMIPASMVPPRGVILPVTPRDVIVSPAMTPSPPMALTDNGDPESVLDFSTKKKQNSDSGGALNLSKTHSGGTPSPPVTGATGEIPLDLSVRRKRAAASEMAHPTSRKSSRVDGASSYKSGSPWGAGAQFPFFSPNSMSPKSAAEIPLWNGKMKMDKTLMSPGSSSYGMPTTTQNEATRALEKMTELSRFGGDAADLFRTALGAGGRPSAWQTHWLNKGAEQAKDVLKCVWCKQSFPSLAAMTAHMKEAKHCGVSVPAPAPPSSNSPAVSSSASASNTSHSSIPPSSTSMSAATNTLPSPSTSSKSSSDLNLLIKETMPLPRKLVRGQDVWLGKGAEQTRQILKCMWCGQSFRSLAEMTSHMQQTQHYTNIISQEQIISWRSADDKANNQSHVSAVLTCKVCDQAFSSLKELSNHMVKNSHYKEHIMRSITESGGRRRQTREKRKKSLPVRKLLELERAQNELKNSETKHHKEGSGRITCEKCGDKIETPLFVDHIRQCVGNNQRNLLKSALMSPNADTASSSPENATKRESKAKSETPSSGDTPAKDGSKASSEAASDNEGSPSVLNAIEKLIEKSFDSRVRQSFSGTPMGSSILKRLGIDESVDYTKPLVDSQSMNFLRCYQYQQQRERSGSESSAMSDKGKGDGISLVPAYRSSSDAASPAGSTTAPLSPKTPPLKKEPSPKPSEKTVTSSETASEQPQSNGSHKEACERDDTTDETLTVTANGALTDPNSCKESDDASERAPSPAGSITEEEKPDSPAKPAPANATDSDEGNDAENDSAKASDEETIVTPTKVVANAGTNQHAPNAETPGSANNASSPCPSPFSDHSNASCASRREKKSQSPEPPESAKKTKKKKKGGKGDGGGGGGGGGGSGNSLSALSSMFESLSGTPAEGSSHPLAALQKLCDKTESHASRPGTSGTYNAAQGTPGAILAFSWACNDAVMTDSIMKCAFCDTPFISKGAYRHHLSKMHFVKDGAIPDPLTLKGQQQGSKAAPLKSPQPPPANFEESPHSKFLKYTELAKQLSSKYV